MSTRVRQALQGAAGAAGGAGLNVEDVFSTYLYTGTDYSGFDINNGIDLSTEGGMIWNKGREINNSFQIMFDTERGRTKYLFPSESSAESTNTSVLSSFNTDGVTLGSRVLNGLNDSRQSNTLWTFRKAPKFFDIVTYTGTGSTQNISHDLGCDVGMLMVKCLNDGENWRVWHKDLQDGDTYLSLNSNSAESNDSPYNRIWNATDPTSTQFTVGSDNSTNGSGKTYVAYLFAHNDGDGDFGPTGDQDIIKCGKYVGNGSSLGPEIDLGFEPQWLLVKRRNSASSWFLFDNMRGMNANGRGYRWLVPDTNSVESYGTNSGYAPLPTGFQVRFSGTSFNASNNTYIYMAIRRGPMAVPESGTDVFAMDRFGATSPSPPALTSGFPVDFGFYRYITSGGDYNTHFRLNQERYLKINAAEADVDDATARFDYMDGYYSSGSYVNDFVGWMWRRAPNFFDVIGYTGNGTNGRNLNHNLGVVPEFFIVKHQTDSKTWYCYHKDIDVNGDGNPETDYIRLNTDDGAGDYNGFWNDTAPTATHITLGNDADVNGNGSNYIALLFASLDGISKVGGYSGNGTSSGNSQTITTGFQPRLVWIKRWDSSGSWMLFDTERGINSSGAEDVLLTNTTNTGSNGDRIDLTSTGFTVKWYNDTNTNPNINGADYIYYAIA